MGSRTRIELDKFEVWTVLGIIFLFSGLVFTFGILVGIKMRPADDAATHVAHATGGGHGSGDRHPASTSHDAHAPAAEAAPAEAGALLKQAYVDAKQRALRDSVLQENRESQPKSVADAAAHFEANDAWNRRPAESVEQEDANRYAKAREQEQERLAKGPTDNVRALFERNPASLSTFEPRVGQFTVHLGSYATRAEATAKVQSLRKLRFNDAYFAEVKVGEGDRWYRVGVGSFVERSWAAKMGERLLKSKATKDFKVAEVK